MSERPLNRALVGLLSLALAAPMAPLPVMAQEGRAIDPDKPSDGVVSPAACRVFGFDLEGSRSVGFADCGSGCFIQHGSHVPCPRCVGGYDLGTP
jgi:hypothetical protein